jgi:DNA-binding FadR family transcriptional regulator
LRSTSAIAPERRARRRAASRKAPRGHLADRVFEALARAILAGDLRPGARLAPERTLSARHRVSPLLVRQALHRLAELGLVRVRQGGATHVCDPAACDHPMVSALALRFAPARAGMLAHLRERQVAGSFAMLLCAARRAREADRVAMRRAVEDMEREPHAADRHNEIFWLAVADATDNPFFQREARYWFRLARETLSVARRPTLAAGERASIYRGIVAALDAGELPVEAYRVALDRLLARIDQGRRR